MKIAALTTAPWPNGQDAISVIDGRACLSSSRSPELRTLDDVARAIQTMVVRGAPLIGPLPPTASCARARCAVIHPMRTSRKRHARCTRRARPPSIWHGP